MTDPVSATFITLSQTELSRGLRVTFWFLLSTICFLSVLLPGTPILGEWESQSVYAIFGTQTQQLALSISPAANIGGQSYILVDISRSLIETLNLPYSIDTIRLPVKIIGAIGLFGFCITARRWFGSWPALAATFLLAANPMYHQYQNELIIAGPSLVAFILLVERLQYVAREPGSWSRWLTLMLIWTLLLTMYGPSRIYGTILVVAWLSYCLYQSLRRRFHLRFSSLALRAAVSVSLVPITLAMADPSNVQFFNRTILFPRVAESTLVNGSWDAVFKAFPINTKILAESLLLGGGPYQSTFVEATLIQGRYPTIPLLIVPFMLMGLAIVFWRAWLGRRFGLNRYLVVAGLAVLTTLPLLTSSIFSSVYGPSSSLVNHRMAFFLLPAYLAVAALGEVLLTRTRAWRLAGAATFLLVGCIGLGQIFAGNSSFVARAAGTDPSLTGKSGQAQWLQGYSLIGKGSGQGSHFQQHEQYKRWAGITAHAIRTRPQADIIIVPTNVSCFPEAPFETHTLSELRDKNYHGTYLSLYLADALGGNGVGYVSIPPMENPEGYVMYKPGVFPGPLTTTSSGVIDAKDADTKAAQMVGIDSTPQVIVTTTPTELQAAKRLLTEQSHAFDVFDSPLPCWGAG